LGSLGPTPWDVDVADPLRTCFSLTYVTVPNSIILGQNVRL